MPSKCYSWSTFQFSVYYLFFLALSGMGKTCFTGGSNPPNSVNWDKMNFRAQCGPFLPITGSLRAGVHSAELFRLLEFRIFSLGQSEEPVQTYEYRL